MRLKIKQVDLLEETLEQKIEKAKILESNDNISDPNWDQANDYYLPTQLSIKEFIDQKVVSIEYIGTPTDNDYNDGFFQWSETTRISNAVDDINEVLNDIIINEADLLTNKDLTGPILFSGKLSANNINQINWNINGISNGDIINNIIDEENITLLHDDINTCFHGGYKKDYPTNLNTKVYAWKTNNTYTTYTNFRLLNEGIGSTGILEINDISVYNNTNIKVNAKINSILNEGYNKFKLTSDLANTSNDYEIYYTGNYISPNFSIIPVIGENVIHYKYLSGVQYYTSNSSFNIGYSIENLYNPIYSVNEQSLITSDFFTSTEKNYTAIPNYNSILVVNETLTLLNNKTSNNELGNGTVTAFKPNKTDILEEFTIGNKPINTYGNISTGSIEYFLDEAKRCTSKDNLLWDSQNVFSNTEGQLEVQNGKLIDPRFSNNYTLYTENVNYYRRFLTNRTFNIDKGTILITKSNTLNNPTSWKNSNGGKFQMSFWLERNGSWTQFDLGTGIGLEYNDGGEGILDETNSSDGVIKWVLDNEYIKTTDILILDIKFNNVFETDYITKIEIIWNE